MSVVVAIGAGSKRGRPRRLSRDELRARILVHAQEIVEKKGLNGLGMRGLAASVGYTPGALYHVYNDLGAIIAGVEQCVLNQFLLRLSASLISCAPHDRLRSLVRAYFEYAQNHPKLWALIADGRLNSGAPVDFAGVMECVSQALRAAAPKVQHDNLQRSTEVFWCLLHGAASTRSAQTLIPDVQRFDMAEAFLTIYGDHLKWQSSHVNGAADISCRL